MRTLFINNNDLTVDKKSTFLTTDIVSGSSTLSVISIIGFAVNQILCIGEIGEENSEIVKTHSSTAPSGTTITLASALTFSHNRGTKVYIIDYDQVEISWAATTTGTKTVLDTISIQSDQDETIYKDESKSSGYYFSRFVNSVPTPDTYSDYSDPISYSGYGANTVWAIKNRALNDLGEKIDGVIISNSWLNEALWEGRRELDEDEGVGKWSFRIKRNYNAGSIIPGTYQLTLPTNLRKPNTAENILSIRIGEDGQPLDYEDIVRFNKNYQGIHHTTLGGAVADSDTSITLTDSGDFDESGSIYVAGDSVDDTIDTIAYTANAETTNIISGVTGIQTGGHGTSKDVWQNASFGLPTTYTINGEDKKAEFDIPFGNDYAGENIFMDYYSTLPDYDSDGDELDEKEYDLFVDWLKWKIKYKKSNGKLKPTEDGDYLLWEKKKKSFIAKERLGQDIYFVPDY
jgi:hypothetical protein